MQNLGYNLDSKIQEYKLENYKALGPMAVVIYVLLAFTDHSIIKSQLPLLLALRFLFIIPTGLGALLAKKVSRKNVDKIIFFGFFMASLGVSIISYLLGGIGSDYYFGIIVISFVQYAFVPMPLGWVIVYDLSCYIVFYGINCFLLPYEMTEVVKQSSNYWSFVLLKFFVANRSLKLIRDAMEKVTLEKEIRGREEMQNVLGELCHLFNNPLFISLGMTSKLIKEEQPDSELSRRLSKIHEANTRMEKVLKKMLNLQSRKDYKVTKEDLLVEES